MGMTEEGKEATTAPLPMVQKAGIEAAVPTAIGDSVQTENSAASVLEALTTSMPTTNKTGARQPPPPPSAVAFDEPSVPAFLLKLYTMLEDPNSDDIIGWSTKGDTFIVYNPSDFASMVLPQFFKHSNFQSFIRQLNLYGFHKLKQAPDWHEFTHPVFKRAHKHLLKDIKRKIPANSKTKRSEAKKLVDADLSSLRAAQVASQERIARLERQNQLVENENRTLWKEVLALIEDKKVMSQKVDKLIFIGQMLQPGGMQHAASATASTSTATVASAVTTPTNGSDKKPPSPSAPSTDTTLALTDSKRAFLGGMINKLQSKDTYTAQHDATNGAIALSHLSQSQNSKPVTAVSTDQVGEKRDRDGDDEQQHLLREVQSEVARRATEDNKRLKGASSVDSANSADADKSKKLGGFGQWLQVDQSLKEDQMQQMNKISEMESSLMAGGYPIDASDLSELVSPQQQHQQQQSQRRQQPVTE